MIPYFEQPVFHLGPVTIHAFGIAVATGIMVGINFTERFCKRNNLSINVVTDLIWYALVFGFVSAHVFDTVAYYPERIVENPLFLLRIWDGISSFGGMMGGVLGMYIFFRFKAKDLSTPDKLRYVDSIAYGWPFAWVFGRLGCTMAFDHPGTFSHFFLATSMKTEAARSYIHNVYDSLGRTLPSEDVLQTLGVHNLGFYECLATLLILAPATYILGRKQRAPGFFLAFFLLLYTPIRFGLDFLRIADVTYFHFTPAQWACIGIFPIMLFFTIRLRRHTPDEETVNSGKKHR